MIICEAVGLHPSVGRQSTGAKSDTKPSTEWACEIANIRWRRSTLSAHAS